MGRNKGSKNLNPMAEELKLKVNIPVRLTEGTSQMLEELAAQKNTTAIAYIRDLIQVHLESVV